ncbi:hypothetical protein PTTG_00779 [Puccinia triticina 1-1 BBBD Race 1]|uniref:Uncharacterized protein n=1 Tax=Puccinia triticina (isolate 1-1 / race 1 (BBBD)) TaxID=630390 RepID=A0A180GQQ6_PUCT1|nr:hypothetical protein PTTG_00779 [Puccinia triticina 1-1 BBBD Race 1]
MAPNICAQRPPICLLQAQKLPQDNLPYCQNCARKGPYVAGVKHKPSAGRGQLQVRQAPPSPPPDATPPPKRKPGRPRKAHPALHRHHYPDHHHRRNLCHLPSPNATQGLITSTLLALLQLLANPVAAESHSHKRKHYPDPDPSFTPALFLEGTPATMFNTLQHLNLPCAQGIPANCCSLLPSLPIWDVTQTPLPKFSLASSGPWVGE